MAANPSRAVAVSRPLVSAAAAASMLLGLSALPASAQTQYYDFSGSVYTDPFNFFPIDRFFSFYDFTGSHLEIGNSALGSFSMLAGARFKVDAVSIDRFPKRGGRPAWRCRLR